MLSIVGKVYWDQPHSLLGKTGVEIKFTWT